MWCWAMVRAASTMVSSAWTVTGGSVISRPAVRACAFAVRARPARVSRSKRKRFFGS